MPFSGRVHCYTCNKDLIETSASDLMMLFCQLETAVACCHFCAPCSANHQIRMHVDGDVADILEKGFKDKLVVKVDNPRSTTPTQFDEMIPPYLIGATCIAIHAANEGRPLDITYGKQFHIRSPGFVERPPSANVQPTPPITPVAKPPAPVQPPKPVQPPAVQPPKPVAPVNPFFKPQTPVAQPPKPTPVQPAVNRFGVNRRRF